MKTGPVKTIMAVTATALIGSQAMAATPPASETRAVETPAVVIEIDAFGRLVAGEALAEPDEKDLRDMEGLERLALNVGCINECKGQLQTY